MPDLYELIFSKDPCNFTPLDQQLYKQIMEILGVHRDSRGYLKNQASKTKFNKIFRPLFKNKTKYSRAQVLNKVENMNEKNLMIDDEVKQRIVQNRLNGKYREDKHIVRNRKCLFKSKDHFMGKDRAIKTPVTEDPNQTSKTKLNRIIRLYLKIIQNIAEQVNDISWVRQRAEG